MSILKTLGGDRLGAGKKQKIALHGFERSTHNLSKAWRSTMSSGTLVPFMASIALPGDTWDLDLEADVKTHPTIAPLFGSYKVQVDIFQVPIRLYNARLHNNELNIGRKMSEVKLPQIELFAPQYTGSDFEGVDADNMHINPSCILKHLGIAGVGLNTDEPLGVTRQFNITALLMYWEIVKYYYANKQEEIGAVIHTPITALVNTIDDIEMQSPSGGSPLVTITTPPAAETPVPIQAGSGMRINFTGATPLPEQVYVNILGLGFVQISTLATSMGFVSGGAGILTGSYSGVYGNITIMSWRYRNATDAINVPPTVTTFPLENIDEMRRRILKHDNSVLILNDEVDGDSLTPYSYLTDQTLDGAVLRQSQEGLACKTYQSDLLNNWVNTTWMDEINDITKIDTTGGSFSIENLILQKKLYNMYMRIAVSGGTYNDWMEVTYDVAVSRKAESPIYEGGLIKELVFQEVISNSESTSGQPLGTLAGRGIMGNKHKGGKVTIKVEEHSVIIGIISLTPRIDNSQGNDWSVHLKTMEDFHNPGLDGIGFQDLITEQMHFLGTEWSVALNRWVQQSAGKQPAWTNYMTEINTTRGNFAIATNEMFMTLNRRYEMEITGIKDITTYIDPAKFNFIFAETALDAQNFWVQIGIGAQVRRKMSAKVMPNI